MSETRETTSEVEELEVQVEEVHTEVEEAQSDLKKSFGAQELAENSNTESEEAENEQGDENWMDAENQPVVHGPKTKSGKLPTLNAKAMKFLGYESEEQLMRAKALTKMGLTEDDMYQSEPLFVKPEAHQRAVQIFAEKGFSGKLPKLTGASEEQILRRKAVDTLGATEDEIEDEREHRLAALGTLLGSASEKPKPDSQILSCLR